MVLLREAVDRHRPDLLPLLDKLGEGRLTADEKNELRLAVGSELMQSGFGENWEPNERGLQLEQLVDELAPWHTSEIIE
jgi:hypothetical protein